MLSTSTAISSDALINQLEWRYATKQFDATRKLDPETWKALEEALVLTPSSYGLQPYKFVVVTDPALKANLRPASWGQSQIEDASHLVEGLDPAAYDAILGLEAEGYATVCACAAGYRSEGDKYASLPKVRFPEAELVQSR